MKNFLGISHISFRNSIEEFPFFVLYFTFHLIYFQIVTIYKVFSFLIFLFYFKVNVKFSLNFSLRFLVFFLYLHFFCNIAKRNIFRMFCNLCTIVAESVQTVAPHIRNSQLNSKPQFEN